MSQIPLLHSARWAWDYRRRTSIPFYLRPGDGVRTPLSGQAAAVTRTSIGYTFDRDGKLYVLPPGLPRIMMVDAEGGTGPKLRPAYVVEPSATYKCLQNENVGVSPWTVANTPAVGATLALGAMSLQEIIDDHLSLVEEFQQAFAASAFTSPNVVLSFLVAKSALAATSGAHLQFRDTTAGLDRFIGRIEWTGSAPNVTEVTAGVYRGAIHIGSLPGNADPAYLVAVAPSALTTSNAHRFSIGAAAVGSEQGRIFAGGYTVSDGPFLAMPHEVAGTNATRSADAWNAPWGAPCRACTIYLEFLELGACYKAGQLLFALTDAGNANPSLKIQGSGTGYQVVHHNGTSAVTSDISAPAAQSFFQRVRLRCRLSADGSVQIHQRRDNATEASGTQSLPLALASAWGAGGLTTSKVVIGPGPMLLLGAVVVWRDTPSDRLDHYL